MSKDEAKEFLAEIATEMQYPPERDNNGKITNVNYWFRQHNRNDSLWQPKAKRGLSWRTITC